MYGPPQFSIQHHMPRLLPAAQLAKPGAATGPTGLAALLQRPGLRDALMAAGSALLAQSSQPGNIGSALGNALPIGMQAFRSGQQEAQVNELMAGAPVEMQRLLKALPSQARVPALLSMMKPKELVKLNKNERLIDPSTNEELVGAVPEVEKPPAEIQTFREYLSMSPEQQAAFRQFQEAKRGPSTTVNVGAAEGGVRKAIGEAAYGTITGAKEAQSAVQKVVDIDRVIELTSNPKFRKVSGPIMGGKWGELNAQLADDPEARELLAEFNALGGQMTMAQLEAFTGPKTDFEFMQAKRLVFNDPKMTVEEIQAGLKIHREAAKEQAKRWADNMLELDPSRLNFDPRDVGPQLDLAQQISRQYGSRAAGKAKTSEGQRLLKMLGQ